MRLTPSHQNETVIELEDSEAFEPHILLATMSRAVNTNSNLWNLILLLAPAVANEHAEFIRSQEFVVGGFVSRDNVTYLKLVKRIQTSGEAGGSLAVAEPMLPPSAHEVAAVQEMVRRYGPRSGAA